MNDLSKTNSPFNNFADGYEVIFGQDVTRIPSYIFWETSKLAKVTMGENIVTIGECAFTSCGKIQTVVIPAKVTDIGGCAFQGCTGITSLTLGSSLKTIGENAFDGCTALGGTISIPNSVTEIGNSAFSGTSITELTMGDKIQSIGERAFYGCDGLNHMEFGSLSNVTYVGAYVFGHNDASNAEVNYKFKNLVSGEIEFNQGNVKDGLFSDRVYEKKSGMFTMESADITFDPNGGSGTKTILTTDSIGKIKTGEFPADPTREGYIFLGWYDGKTKITEDTRFDKNTTVLAKWGQEYTITFNPNGGTCDVQTVKTNAEGKLTSLPTATREGYTFDGWYLNGEKVTQDTVFTENATVTAQWTAVPGPEPEPEKDTSNDFNWALFSAFIIALLAVIYVGIISRD